MPKYEICLVSKEYRWVEIDADTENDARDKAWDMVACGYIGDTKFQDSETDVYCEGIVAEEIENENE
jgi:hypothetical protein